MIQRLINEIRFAISALILTYFLDAHTIYASSDFRTYHISSLSLREKRPPAKQVVHDNEANDETSRQHCFIRKNYQRYHEKTEEKKFEKYGQMPFQNSNIFHDNVHRLQIREK